MAELKVIAYSAGLFDGEGCIGITRYRYPDGHNPLRFGYRLRCRVALTKREPIDFLKAHWGGTIYIDHRRRRNPNHNPAFNWQIESRRAIQFLEAISSYSLLKREHIELAKRMRDELERFIPGQTIRRGHVRSNESWLRLAEFYKQMAMLNNRGKRQRRLALA